MGFAAIDMATMPKIIFGAPLSAIFCFLLFRALGWRRLEVWSLIVILGFTTLISGRFVWLVTRPIEPGGDIWWTYVHYYYQRLIISLAIVAAVAAISLLTSMARRQNLKD